MSSPESIPVIATGVVSKILGSPPSGKMEAIIVLPSQGREFVVNEVAARIWSLVDGQRSVREIAALVHAEYRVEQDQASVDTLSFLEDLAHRGAIIFREKSLLV